MSTQSSDVLHPVGQKNESGIARGRIYSFLHSELFVDSVAVFFLASGILRIFLPLTIADKGLLDSGGWVLAFVALFAALSYRWWLGPVLAVLGIAGAAAGYHYTEQLGARVTYWTEYAKWLLDGLPEHVVFTGDTAISQLKLLLVFVVTLTVFFIVRRMFVLWFFSLTLFVIIIAGDTASKLQMVQLDFFTAISIYMIGLFPLISRTNARHMQRLNSADKYRRAAMQLIAVPGAALAVLFSNLIIPQSTHEWHNKFLSDWERDIGYLVNGPIAAYPGGSGNFGIAALGMQQRTDRLGGPAILPDWHMLTVVTEQPILLRGAVMDRYTGTNWETSADDGDFRYERFFWNSRRASSFDLNMPLGGEEAELLYNSISEEIEMQIAYQNEYYSTLFSNGQLKEIELQNNRHLSTDIFFNDRSELYMMYAVPGGETVNITTRMIKPLREQNEDVFLNLEELALAQRDSRFNDIARRYTQLPETLPESVRETANRLVEGEASPYLRAKLLSKYLGENFSYTLYPEQLPANKDFVEYFLESGEGYCTYYASAMAVMARVAGLPSRYVTGFALQRDQSLENTYYATGKTAHAWAEIYFSGIGWVTFDPLEWDVNQPLNQMEEQHEASETSGYMYEEEEEYEQDFSWYNFEFNDDEIAVDIRVALVIAMGVLLLALVVYLATAWSSKRRNYKPGYAAKKYTEIAARFEYYYSDIMRQLDILGAPVKPGETLTHYPQRADALVKTPLGNMTTIAEVQIKRCFADIEPVDADLDYIAQYHDALELMLREKLTWFAYMQKRALK